MKWKNIPKDIRMWMRNPDYFPMIIYDTEKRLSYTLNTCYELQNPLLFSIYARREKYKYTKIEQL